MGSTRRHHNILLAHKKLFSVPRESEWPSIAKKEVHVGCACVVGRLARGGWRGAVGGGPGLGVPGARGREAKRRSARHIVHRAHVLEHDDAGSAGCTGTAATPALGTRLIGCVYLYYL